MRPSTLGWQGLCLRSGGVGMGKIPQGLKDAIAWNIRDCRQKKFPGHGGSKRCAEAFGVAPQQWSPWESGKRTPDELRLAQLAEFFRVSVEYLRRDNAPAQKPLEPNPQPAIAAPHPTHAETPAPAIAGCPFHQPPGPDQPPNNTSPIPCRLLDSILGSVSECTLTLRLRPDDMARLLGHCFRQPVPE